MRAGDAHPAAAVAARAASSRLPEIATRRRRALLLTVAIAGILPARASAQTTGNQVYTAVAPCRLVDTRSATPATMLAPNVPRSFNVVGGTDLAAQGGNPGGCGIPGYGGLPTPTWPRVQAVMLSFVAVAPQGHGNLRAWASGAPPVASVLNFVPGVTVANGLAVPIAQDGTPGADLLVQADVAATHLVVDVLGYFSERHPLAGQARPGAGLWSSSSDPQVFELCTGANGVTYGLSYSTTTAENARAACEAGYWVCSRADRGTAACDTQRPGGDTLNCEGTLRPHEADAHPGWLADVVDGTVDSQFAGATENGGQFTLHGCYRLPVWCCTL